MVTLRDIMSRDVITVTPETSLREVAALLASEHISGAPVVAADGRVAGVVSATDLMEFDAENPAGADRSRGEPGATAPEPEWWDGADEPPAGFFTETWGSGGESLLERFGAEGEAGWGPMEEHVVSEVMTRSVVGLSPDTDVRSAAATMVEADVQRVLVVEEDRLVGVVTSRDVVRAVAERGLGN